MVWKEIADKIFRRDEKKEEDDIEKRISKLGIDVVNDRKLKERMQLLNAMHDVIEEGVIAETPIKRIEEWKGRLQAINRALKVVSVPYGRAGEEYSYRQAMHGWETLYSLAIHIVDAVENMIKTVDENKDGIADAQQFDLLHKSGKINMEEVARKLEGFLQIEVFPYVLYIMDSSYWDKDVAPSYTAVIQTMQPLKPREDMRYDEFGDEGKPPES